MDTHGFQCPYYIRECALLPDQIKNLSTWLSDASDSPFSPFPHLEYNKHTTSSDQAGPAKFLPQAYGVDSRSCEHTYDPIEFINQVHPPLPGLTSFLPVAWLQGISPSRVGPLTKPKGRDRWDFPRKIPHRPQLIFLLPPPPPPPPKLTRQKT